MDGLFDQGKAMPACLDLSPRQVFQSLRQDFQSLRLKSLSPGGCRREAVAEAVESEAEAVTETKKGMWSWLLG